MHFSIENTISQGNKVAVSWIATGTHRGPFMHIPATGRSVFVRGMSMLTVEEAQIVGAVYIWDVAGLLRDLGLLPQL